MVLPRRPGRSLALVAALAGVLAAMPAAGASDADRDTWKGHVLDVDDAVLARPEEPVTRILAPFQGCQVLLDAGDGDCAVVRAARGDVVVTVEPGPRIDDVLVSRPWTVRVFRHAAGVPDGWEESLTTGAPSSAVYAGVSAKAVDVTGDGKPELVVGYRSEGTGMILDVDIVTLDDEGVPQVAAHDRLYKGSVVFRRGRLVAWTPVYRRNDANCCPTWIERDVLAYRHGRFAVDPGPRVRSEHADVPASELA